MKTNHGGRTAPTPPWQWRLASAITYQDVSAASFYGEGYDDTFRRIPNINKAKQLLSWKPSISLSEALPSIVDDYVQRYFPLVNQTEALDRVS